MGSLLKLIMWHGFFKTPVTFPKTQKWNSSGGSSAVGMTYFDSLFWPTHFVFVGQRYLSLCQGPIFSVVEYSVEQPSIRVRPSELRQFIMSVAGRSTMRHLEISWMSADRHRLNPRVDWSIWRIWQIDRWTVDGLR